jgi:Zinc knuckle
MAEQGDTTADKGGKGTSPAGAGGRKPTAGRVLGKTEELGEHVFKSNTKDQVDACIRAIDNLGEFVGVKYSKDMKMLVKYGKEKEFPEVEGGKDKMTAAETEIFRAKLASREKKKTQYEDHKAKTFLVILGQCSQEVVSRLESDPDFEKLESTDDVVGLLDKLKAMAYTTDDVQHPLWTAVNVTKRAASINQGPSETVTGYAKRFRNLYKVTEISAWGEGEFFPRKTVVTTNDKGKALSEAEVKANKEKTRAQYRAMAFLHGLDKRRFGRLLEELSNSYISGKDIYPTSLQAAIHYVSNYQNHQAGGTGKAVDNEYTPVATSFNQQLSRVRCFSCNEPGHVAKNCPKKKKKKPKDGHQNNQVESDEEDDNRSRGSNRTPPSQEGSSGWFSTPQEKRKGKR